MQKLANSIGILCVAISCAPERTAQVDLGEDVYVTIGGQVYQVPLDLSPAADLWSNDQELHALLASQQGGQENPIEMEELRFNIPNDLSNGHAESSAAIRRFSPRFEGGRLSEQAPVPFLARDAEITLSTPQPINDQSSLQQAKGELRIGGERGQPVTVPVRCSYASAASPDGTAIYLNCFLTLVMEDGNLLSFQINPGEDVDNIPANVVEGLSLAATFRTEDTR